MESWLKFAVIFTIFAAISDSVPIDNGVVGEPTIQCTSDALTVTFTTQKPFEGRVFAKGFVDQLPCVGVGRGGQSPALNLSFSQCGVQRSRQQNPPGITIYTTIVVSFHKTFITKVDRAYRVSCFYMEASKTVSAELEVSMLSTGYVTSQFAMPSCRYEILRGGPTGTTVKYVKVGEMVYHKWSCDSQDNVFCMNVHSCSVDDGQGGQPFQVLDSKGCAIDRYVLQNLEYLSDTMAGKEAHVFKFADKPALYFSCQIGLFVKSPDAKDCKSIRTTCEASATSNIGGNTVKVGINDRNVRDAHHKQLKNKTIISPVIDHQMVGNFDLPRQKLFVLDIEETQDSPNSSEIEEFYRNDKNLQYDVTETNLNSVCLSVQTFGLVISALILIFILVLIFSSRSTLLKNTRFKKRFSN